MSGLMALVLREDYKSKVRRDRWNRRENREFMALVLREDYKSKVRRDRWNRRENRELVALIRRGPDEAAAAAVAAFSGDINAADGEGVLVTAVHHARERTILACGARADLDPTGVDKQAALALACTRQATALRALLRAFPGLSVNGTKPLTPPLFAAALSNRLDCLCVLLNAGANVLVTNTLGHTPAQCARLHGFTNAAKLLERHATWVSGHRCAWLLACVVLANGSAAAVSSAGTPLAAWLHDALRICIPPAPEPANKSTSEYACMVGSFL